MLSLVLRHKPEAIGIALDAAGWADVATLLARLQDKGFAITPGVLQHIVDTNNKKRFLLSADKTKIRASQGHSLNVDLGYDAVQPPELLFHGTAQKHLAAIGKEGLKKGARQHVHLSADAETAQRVGQRHGIPAVLQVAAGKMYADGFQFFCSDNGVWLTDAVPVAYLLL